jgi:hypothetical protein
VRASHQPPERRLQLRGPCGARDEFLLAATPQNLRKQGNWSPHRRPCRPPERAPAPVTSLNAVQGRRQLPDRHRELFHQNHPNSGRAEARLRRAQASPCVDGSPLARVAWACCEASRCCHVSTRRTYAAGPNAFRGTDPDHKHAFEDALAKLGCSVPGTDRLSALHSVRPSQPYLVAVVRRYAACPTGSLYRSPLVMIAQMMRAVLLASATTATLVVRCARNCTSHGRRVPCRCA